MQSLIQLICHFLVHFAEFTSIRSGLRKRKRAESPQKTETQVSEEWVDEDKLKLWEIKLFGEKYLSAWTRRSFLIRKFIFYFFEIPESNDQSCRPERQLENCLSSNPRLPMNHRHRIASANRQRHHRPSTTLPAAKSQETKSSTKRRPNKI